MAPTKKGEKKKGRSAINEVVTREYTINVHKRIHGVWVLHTQEAQKAVSVKLIFPFSCRPSIPMKFAWCGLCFQCTPGILIFSILKAFTLYKMLNVKVHGQHISPWLKLCLTKPEYSKILKLKDVAKYKLRYTLACTCNLYSLTLRNGAVS